MVVVLELLAQLARPLAGARRRVNLARGRPQQPLEVEAGELLDARLVGEVEVERRDGDAPSAIAAKSVPSSCAVAGLLAVDPVAPAAAAPPRSAPCGRGRSRLPSRQARAPLDLAGRGS